MNSLTMLWIIPCIMAVFAVQEMIPARTTATYYNPQYIKYLNVSTHRYGRRGSYVTDLYAILRHAWGNNITAEVVFYEFLSNEYKRTFLQMSMKLCDYFTKDRYIGPIVKKAFMGNFTCPFRAGVYRLSNLTVGVNNVPPNFPFKKGRMNVDFLLTSDGTLLGTGITYIQVIDRMTRKGSKT